MVKVIASDVRKGNVLENEDGKLYTVLKAETYRPGKGTPTTGKMPLTMPMLTKA